MSESGDYVPSSWSRGHDFSDARSSYAKHIDRSYTETKTNKVITNDLVPKFITATGKRLLVIVFDLTGSMEEWPKTIFSKGPYLEHEAKEYLGRDVEICYMAVCDAGKEDKYPLQVRPPAKGEGVVKELENFKFELKCGGNNGKESYELAALYCLSNIRYPNKAETPIIIYIGDEGLYESVSVFEASEFAKDNIPGSMPVKEVFEQLKEKSALYIIRKKYRGICTTDEAVNKQWVDLLGQDHVSNLDNPERVLDVIFGILAKETKREGYFRDEFENRQKDHPEYFPPVYKALKSIHRQKNKAPKIRSISQSNMHFIDDDEGVIAEPLIVVDDEQVTVEPQVITDEQWADSEPSSSIDDDTGTDE